MGLFSFLKSDKPTYSDRVWRTSPMAMRGMITDAMQAITHKQVPVVLCYFDNELNQINAFLSEKRVPNSALANYNRQEQVVWYSLASTATSLLSSLPKESVTILFFGHYPLPTKENELLQKIQQAVPSAKIVFYSSLDEPAFKIFGGERLTSLLDSMGMKEDEAIEHAMVTRSMLRAREKVQSSVRTEISAQSEEEWYAKNVKQPS